MVMVGLVGSNNHFVADVIAGFFLGLAAAAGTVTLMPANQKDF
jgi:membrane-associated phospholipid phosphatase